MIDVRKLSFAWPDAAVSTLHNLNWQISAGEFALLIGRSGSGKSTLLRTLNGLVPHFSGGTFGGEVVVNNANTKVNPPRDMARHVGFVFQDPEAQLLTNCVVDDIAFGMEQMETSPAIMRKRVEEMLDLVGIAHLRDRDPATLSGGERQRVAIAAALALHPPVLVLDEPTSQLDPWGAEEVIAALSRMNSDLGLTVVMSEHRLDRVLDHADSVRLLDEDGVPTDGTPAQIAREVAAVALPPVSRLGRHFDWQDVPLTVKQARQHRGLIKLRTALETAQPQGKSARVGDPLLNLDDVSVTLDRRTVLSHASLTLHAGEIMALIGRNGSGKTTLLRSIIGFVPDVKGHIVAKGSIAYVPQRSSALFFKETLREELEFTARKRGVAINPEELLAEMNLEWAIDRHPSTLSIGERQRAAIAIVLAGDPTILLLDEPTRGMDPWHKRQLSQVLKRVQARGVGILMATHDIELAAEIAQNVVMLGDGGIVASGPPEAVLTDSLTYSTHVNKLFGGNWLTVDQIIEASR